MSLTIGIVGLPNVGKSTLFNALSRQSVLAANFPFATIEPNVGIVPLPDKRLDTLKELVNAKQTVPATVSFVDIAGIIKGASTGEGMGNAFLANIREADAILLVTRAFENPDIIHVSGSIDPEADIETIQTELILADLQTLEKSISRLEKEARGDKEALPKLELAKTALDLLEKGKPLYHEFIDDAEKLQICNKEFGMMTAKPFIYVFNLNDATIEDDAKKAELTALVAPAQAIFINAEFESELVDLNEAEAKEMLALQGIEESGLDKIAKVGFETLGLQTYLTAGEKEVRAWTIHKGDTAPKAAGVIHTDFERGFIKAEIVSYDDLVELGSRAKAKEAGKLRLEGKEYIMQDGDVVEFKFNV
ncbi:MAG: redox-regulated ATPase YchF [Candidatus Ancillula sp.]|nr:redox-regulated ATPase YchF [Candidatus Ancillula sp.]